MDSITPIYDQATKPLPKYSGGISMANETQLQVTHDDIQVQSNLCYQITESTQIGQRQQEKCQTKGQQYKQMYYGK